MTVYGFNDIEVALKLKSMARENKTKFPLNLSMGTPDPRVPTYAPFLKVLITASISAATWNATTQKLTPQSATGVYRMIPYLNSNGDTDGTWTYEATEEYEIEVKSFYSTDIDVTSGSARLGYVRNGELIIVDCEEFSLS